MVDDAEAPEPPAPTKLDAKQLAIHIGLFVAACVTTYMFGGLALLLASLGLYGTISYGISRRVAELGLRMALGANRGDVLWMVLREAFVLVIAGVLVGIPLAAVTARAISALLIGVGPADPVAFTLGALILMAVATLAAYLPAYRASRIEPMTALSR